MDEMTEWANRPLDWVYPVVFIDAIRVKVRDGQVSNKPFYVAVGVTVNGERDILGIWAGQDGVDEGAKYWLNALTEMKNRGVQDVLILVCDGLKGLPDAIVTVWPDTIVQTCVIHLLRNTFKYAARQDRTLISKAIRPVYEAATVEAAQARFEEFTDTWGRKYPAIINLWHQAWEQFIPFLA
jgi:transposase-like protein